MPTYAYDQEWQEERRRLAGIERLWDPGSRALLERIGVGRDWRCLEVGAGGGAMSEWLAERAGHVVAADISTRFLEAIDRPNLEVLEVDLREDDLPAAAFDLVYSRLVAEHLGDDAVARMAAAVRPGGLLVLEDFDFIAATVDPPDERFSRAVAGVCAFMAVGGFDPYFGRRLANLLPAAGLEDVQVEGRTRVVRGGTDEVGFYRLSLLALRERAAEAGLLDSADAEAALALLDDPGCAFGSPIVVSAWGRRPT